MMGRGKMLAEMQSASTFTDRVHHLLQRVQYRRMETDAELDAVLRLRYDAYFKEGAIPISESGRLEDAFDNVDNVYNFGVFIDGELASALRLHTVSHVCQKSPALETFGDVLRPELRACRQILDPNRFVANYRLSRLHPGLPYVTVRLTILGCIHFGIDLMTMTVRLEHQAFYKRAFFAYPVCPPRPYPLLSKPISLLFLDFEKDGDRILKHRPYWASSRSEREALFGRGPTSRRFRTVASASPLAAGSRPMAIGKNLGKFTLPSPSLVGAR
jgi:N-acyl-L-homoserine lactone synthetase